MIYLYANIVKSEFCSEQCKDILILYGSPKEYGTTGRLLKSFLGSLPFDFNMTFINSYEKNIKPCTACDYCHNHEKCKLDDFELISNSINNADVIIVATPVYFLSFPAPLKAIVDRMQVYWSARFLQNQYPPIKKSKKGILLACSGADNYDGINIIEKQCRQFFSVINTKFSGTITWTGTDFDKIGSDSIKHAKKMAVELFSDD